MNCTENVIWALNYKTLGVFWQTFFCQKMSFCCSIQTLKCQFTKIWQNSFCRWSMEGRRDQAKRKALAFSQVWKTNFPTPVQLAKALQGDSPPFLGNAAILNLLWGLCLRAVLCFQWKGRGLHSHAYRNKFWNEMQFNESEFKFSSQSSLLRFVVSWTQWKRKQKVAFSKKKQTQGNILETGINAKFPLP